MTKIKELFETNELNITLTNKSLTNLKGQGIPNIVQGSFDCDYNELTSLEYGPNEVHGNFSCYGNKLTSLEHAPKEIHGNFFCDSNQLTSLEHCPNKVRGYFYCSNNKLTSLQDIHLLFKGGFISFNIDVTNNPIKSHILGLMLIPELKGIIFKHEKNPKLRLAFQIIDKHLKADRDVWACQEELLDNDLHEFAQI